MRTVADIMSREVSTFRRNDPLAAVGDLMNAKRIRHMPVLDDDGRLAGILSQRDLFLSGLVRPSASAPRRRIASSSPFWSRR